MRTFSALAALLLVVGCDSVTPTADRSADAPASATADPVLTSVTAGPTLAAARRATAPYHDVNRATADGWMQASPCVASPAGGMGYHFVNGSLMDADIVAETPEALLYEPQANGRHRLVAVEYIVPFAFAPADGPAPELFGEHFHANPGIGAWALHVWLWRHNPAGMFADFNPNVTCSNAPAPGA